MKRAPPPTVQLPGWMKAVYDDLAMVFGTDRRLGATQFSRYEIFCTHQTMELGYCWRRVGHKGVHVGVTDRWVDGHYILFIMEDE